MKEPLHSNDGLLETVQDGQIGQNEPDAMGSGGGAGGEPKEIIRVPIGETWCEVAKAESDQRWYWNLWGGHGRAMATSAVGYRNREDCVAAFKAVGLAAADEATKIAVAYLPKKRAK